MTERNEALGTITHSGSTYTARLERIIPHDTSAVWSMLTQPDRLVEWLAPGTIELKPGGAAKLNFTDSGIVIDSRVSAFEAGEVCSNTPGAGPANRFDRCAGN